MRSAQQAGLTFPHQAFEDRRGLLAFIAKRHAQRLQKLFTFGGRSDGALRKIREKSHGMGFRPLEEIGIDKLHTGLMYTISTEKSRLDIDLIHRYLTSDSYWAKNIPRDIVAASIEHSLCFAAFAENEFAGFARLVTDYATFGYVADVFVLPEHRGRGVAKRIMKAMREHPAVQRLRRWHLVTRDAGALYTQFGFAPLGRPERHMELVKANPYG